jgi:hypothetical protein
MYRPALLRLKLFSAGNTELRVAYNTDDDMTLFLYSGEVYPETGYPQSTDGKRFF